MAARITAAHGRFDLNQNAEINVTPFVDVMLVLLIIFMVAAPLATATLRVDLPPVGSHQAAPPRPPVYVDVGLQGRLYVQGEPTTLTALLPDLSTAIGGAKPTNERVMIRGDKEIAYKDLMRVMNALEAGGYYKVGLVGEEI